MPLSDYVGKSAMGRCAKVTDQIVAANKQPERHPDSGEEKGTSS